MTGTLILCAALVMAIVLVVRRYLRFGEASRLAPGRLRPLSKNVSRLMSYADGIRPLIEKPAAVTMSWREIAAMYRNDRILVRSADEARQSGVGDPEETAAIHAVLVETHSQTVLFLRRAAAEMLSNQIFGTHSSLYACAAAWSYGRETVLVSELLEICDDRKSAALVEKHLP